MIIILVLNTTIRTKIQKINIIQINNHLKNLNELNSIYNSFRMPQKIFPLFWKKMVWQSYSIWWPKLVYQKLLMDQVWMPPDSKSYKFKIQFISHRLPLIFQSSPFGHLPTKRSLLVSSKISTMLIYWRMFFPIILSRLKMIPKKFLPSSTN
jgi:hypothetical protein